MDVATTTVGSDLKVRLVREDFAEAVAWAARNLRRARRSRCCRGVADRYRGRVDDLRFRLRGVGRGSGSR